MMHAKMKGGRVHPFALGEGERLANKTAQTLTQGTAPAFDMASLARAFASAAMSAPGKDLVVG